VDDLDRGVLDHVWDELGGEASQETTRELSFSPGLTLGPLQLGTGRIGRTVVLQLATAVTVGYWGEKGAGWILRRPNGQAPGLEGTWEFALILRWPAEISPVRLTVNASAVVSTPHLRWLTRRAEHDYGPFKLRGCKPVI
jgi:hypothetical protein